MTELYDAAVAGNLGRVVLLVEQGTNKNEVGGSFEDTALSAKNNYLAVVQHLVEQGAEADKANTKGSHLTPLHYASMRGHLEVVRYLLEQGANRDKTVRSLWTPLHYAAIYGHLETAKLLMVYGADLIAENDRGQLPIDVARTEEIKQAIRDEPRRRLDHGHKRATEQDRHPNAAAPASAQQEEQEADEQNNKRPADGENKEGKIAEEDEDSEPSDEEYDD